MTPKLKNLKKLDQKIKIRDDWCGYIGNTELIQDQETSGNFIQRLIIEQANVRISKIIFLIDKLHFLNYT